ncbi:MAG: hypothetical protein KKB70_10080 [Proteobacteria bacterium]|nr:hypothetical protein [Pseudomonadota bacterium]
MLFFVVSALAVVACFLLVGYSGDSLGFYQISGGESFSEIKGKLKAQGFAMDGRDAEPFIFLDEDFNEYYTFASQTPLLNTLKKAFFDLRIEEPLYSSRESLYLNTYLMRRSMDDAEAGFCLSAFDGSLLYVYCFVDDILPLLDDYRARFEVRGPFTVEGEQGAYTLWYFEEGGEALIFDTGNNPANDASGGVTVFYAENIQAFYARMRADLKRQGE